MKFIIQEYIQRLVDPSWRGFKKREAVESVVWNYQRVGIGGWSGEAKLTLLDARRSSNSSGEIDYSFDRFWDATFHRVLEEQNIKISFVYTVFFCVDLILS